METNALMLNQWVNAGVCSKYKQPKHEITHLEAFLE